MAISLGGTGAALAQTESVFQQRLGALAQQIDLGYQHNATAIAEYQRQIRVVLGEWNRVAADEATERNKRLLNAWLDASMRAVMPGGSGKLPSAPQFEAWSEAAPSLLAPTEASPVEPRKELRSSEISPPNPVESLPTKSPAGVSAGVAADRSQTPTSWRREVAKPIANGAAIIEPRSLPSRSKWSRHPSAAPLEWRDPFVDDPAASPNPLRSSARRSSQRPALGPSTEVSVNRAQLAAEVRGYNNALGELQRTVIDLTPDDLRSLVEAAERLERLAEQRQFLELYRQGLSVSERGWLPDSPSPELVRELLRRKVRQIAEQSPPLENTRRRELERLSARLALLEGESER